MTSSKRAQNNQPRKRGGWGRLLATLLTIALLVGAALAWLMWSRLNEPLQHIPAGGQLLQVKNGETFGGLIAELAAKKQISSPFAAKLYQRYFIHKNLKAGFYQLPAGITVKQLLQKLSSGELGQMVRLTVVEGTTFKQLKQRLAEKQGITHDLVNITMPDISKKLGITQANPEGWFAPDTYYFANGTSETDILKHLYTAQDKVLKTEWASRAPDLPYASPYEALIMASIVEKETGLKTERPEVAAVFVNRLKKHMRLQTDPTIIYGMGDAYTGKLHHEDVITKTAYNTYQIDGLPPTPIALPGKASIQAALHPAASDALYFVATGHGGHNFSGTLAEHNANLNKYVNVLHAKKQQAKTHNQPETDITAPATAITDKATSGATTIPGNSPVTAGR